MLKKAIEPKSHETMCRIRPASPIYRQCPAGITLDPDCLALARNIAWFPFGRARSKTVRNYLACADETCV